MKKLTKLIWLALAMFLPVSAWAQVTVPSGTTFDGMFPVCARASGATTPILTTPGGEEKCHIQPDEQIVTFYRMMGCTAAPTGPTTTNAAVLTNCKTVFSSTLASGSAVSIVNGTAQPIPNVTIAGDLAGTGPYTHLYLELSPTTMTKAKFEADGVAWNFQTGTSTGKYCQTIDKTYFDFAASASDKMGVVCQGTPFTAGPGTNTITYNSVAAGLAGGANFALLNAPTSSYGPGSLDVYLIKSDGTLVGSGTAGNANGVAKISGVLTLGANAVSIPSNVCGFEVGWNNSRGAGLNKGDRSSTPGSAVAAVGGFDPGPFDMTFTVKNTSSGTCR